MKKLERDVKLNPKKKQELRGGRYRTCIGQSQQTVKYSSRAPGQGECMKGMSRTITMQGFRLAACPGQGECLKGMSRTITMQGFRLAAISDVEKTKLRHKNFPSQWTVKYRSRVWCTRRVKTTGSSPLVNFYQCTAKFYQCTAIFYQCTAKFYQSTDKFTSPLIKFSSALVNLPVH